jgi:uncharacterized protein
MRVPFVGTMLIAGLAAASLSPALAQQPSATYKFMEAVKQRDVNKILDAIEVPGSGLVNTRDPSTGETALHIFTRKRDLQMVRYFLSKKGDANLRDKAGDTPLLIAATIGFVDAEKALIAGGAKVDMTNGSGESPLIRAVQLRDVESVRFLLEAGANPDLRDRVAGRSARDYATADPRGGAILRAIAAAPARSTKPVSGPQL